MASANPPLYSTALTGAPSAPAANTEHPQASIVQPTDVPTTTTTTTTNTTTTTTAAAAADTAAPAPAPGAPQGAAVVAGAGPSAAAAAAAPPGPTIIDADSYAAHNAPQSTTDGGGGAAARMAGTTDPNVRRQEMVQLLHQQAANGAMPRVRELGNDQGTEPRDEQRNTAPVHKGTSTNSQALQDVRSMVALAGRFPSRLFGPSIDLLPNDDIGRTAFRNRMLSGGSGTTIIGHKISAEYTDPRFFLEAGVSNFYWHRAKEIAVVLHPGNTFIVYMGFDKAKSRLGNVAQAKRAHIIDLRPGVPVTDDRDLIMTFPVDYQIPEAYINNGLVAPIVRHHHKASTHLARVAYTCVEDFRGKCLGVACYGDYRQAGRASTCCWMFANTVSGNREMVERMHNGICQLQHDYTRAGENPIAGTSFENARLRVFLNQGCHFTPEMVDEVTRYIGVDSTDQMIPNAEGQLLLETYRKRQVETAKELVRRGEAAAAPMAMKAVDYCTLSALNVSCHITKLTPTGGTDSAPGRTALSADEFKLLKQMMITQCRAAPKSFQRVSDTTMCCLVDNGLQLHGSMINGYSITVEHVHGATAPETRVRMLACIAAYLHNAKAEQDRIAQRRAAATQSAATEKAAPRAPGGKRTFTKFKKAPPTSAPAAPAPPTSAPAAPAAGDPAEQQPARQPSVTSVTAEGPPAQRPAPPSSPPPEQPERLLPVASVAAEGPPALHRSSPPPQPPAAPGATTEPSPSMDPPPSLPPRPTFGPSAKWADADVVHDHGTDSDGMKSIDDAEPPEKPAPASAPPPEKPAPASAPPPPKSTPKGRRDRPVTPDADPDDEAADQQQKSSPPTRKNRADTVMSPSRAADPDAAGGGDV
jgi:hypothetical protein